MPAFQSNAPLLPEIFSLHGKWQAKKSAVICDDTHLNWAEFCNKNHQLGNGLLTLGLSVGDRVGIVMSNSIDMVQALFGVMSAGLVSVPINLSVNDDSLSAMFNDAGVKAIIVTEDQKSRIDHLYKNKGLLLICIKVSDDNWQTISSICDKQATSRPAVTIQNETELNVIYSSGTTGQPKGIVHTQGGRRDWAYDLSIALRYNSGARTLITIGLYSNISWVAMLSTLLAGGTLVIHKRFDAENFLQSCERQQITHTAMVPIQFQRLVEQYDDRRHNVSSMQAMMSCGSPLHVSVKQQLFDVFPCGIIELYGLTEGIITTLQPEEAGGRWQSVGKPLIGTDVCIVGDDDQVLAANTSGEVVSRGRITMSGYLNRPDANRDAEFIDDNGVQWLRSGDIGYLDDEGYLYIVDRKKDMILSGGQNIFPQDIEAILIQHEAVNDVAVIGAKSKRWGETPIALIVAEPRKSHTSLKDWANNQLGKQQRITDVIVVEELPRNPNGKILKRELRKFFAENHYD